MRYFVIPFLILLCSFQSNPGYNSYCNGRFSFCIEYPDDFIPQEKPDNDDGLIFLSKDGKAEIRMFGSLVVEDGDPLTESLKLATANRKVTYKTVKKNWFVISGINENGKVFYRKTVKKTINYFGTGKTDVFQTLMITYPISQKAIYNTYCTKIAKSL